MKKNFYVIKNSRLYKATKVKPKELTLIPSQEPMTMKLAKHTYPSYQLETIGYKIVGDLP